MTKRRVYTIENTPAMGGDLYFDVKDTETAIRLIKYLNKLTKSNNWVWA